MRIDVISLFPEVIEAGVNYSIVKRAQDNGQLIVHPISPREFSKDKHRSVDDTPYGGGSGMVMKPDVVWETIEACKENSSEKPHIVLLEPQAKRFKQETAKEWSKLPHLILICGHYEGIDERVRLSIADETISIGDYVLTGGELPALVIIDAVARLLPGSLGSAESLNQDSFVDGLLGYPQYTRPSVFQGMEAPKVLMNGNHAQIEKWRRAQSLIRTRNERPDLWEKFKLSKQDEKILEEFDKEEG